MFSPAAIVFTSMPHVGDHEGGTVMADDTMQAYGDWFLDNIDTIMKSKDKDRILALGAEMKRIGLLFKESGQGDPKIRADCQNDAGGGGDCSDMACLAGGGGGDCGSTSCLHSGGGGDCRDNSCGNESGGGNCGSNTCESCSSSV
jgi:hypothetical protein